MRLMAIGLVSQHSIKYHYLFQTFLGQDRIKSKRQNLAVSCLEKQMENMLESGSNDVIRSTTDNNAVVSGSLVLLLEQSPAPILGWERTQEIWQIQLSIMHGH